MLSGVFGEAPARGVDPSALSRKCGPRDSALRACVAAAAEGGKGVPRQCARLAHDRDACYASALCPEAHAAFLRCSRVIGAGKRFEGRKDCEVEAQRMRKCLAKAKL